MGQTTLGPFGKINLTGIACDHRSGPETNSRQEHFHLLLRRVLRLIQNDEGVIEGAAAHKCQRRDLDNMALDILIDRLEAQHFV